MSRIRLVLKQDLKSIFTNEITFIVIFTLLILPAIFANFIIKANQAPTGGAEHIKVALINRDVGGIINDARVNIGDEIVALISQDTSIDWQLVSYEDALRGTLIGELYGQVIIPEDFTERVASLNTNETVFPKILYDMHFQENVYAPTFNTINNANFQANIEKRIINTAHEAINNAVGEFNINIEVNTTNTRQLVEVILDLNLNQEMYLTKIREYKELAGTVMVLFLNLNNELADCQGNIEKVEQIQLRIHELSDVTSKLGENYAMLTGENLAIEINKLLELTREFTEIANGIKEKVPELQGIINESRKTLRQIYDILDKAYDAMIELSKQLNGLEEELGFLAQDNDINKLIYNLRNSPELVGQYLETPLLIERIATREVSDEHLIVAPFNIVIAMWLGKAILITLLSTKFKGRLEEEHNIPRRVNILRLQEYFAKGLFLIILGCIQDILIILSVNQLFGIGSAQSGLFLVMGLLGSVTFTVIIYTLVSVFGHIGKIVVYVLSILQLFLLGGIFPLQIIPEIYFNINKVLPFIYLVGSFRELQVGIITENLYKSASILILLSVYTVILGVIGKYYLLPYIDKVCKKVEESHLMNPVDRK